MGQSEPAFYPAWNFQLRFKECEDPMKKFLLLPVLALFIVTLAAARENPPAAKGPSVSEVVTH